MQRIFMASVAAVSMLASGAMAQQQGSHNPAVKDSHPHMLAAPAHGRNSFTEDQARGRLMKAGFARVSKLRKDDNGVWRGMAMRGHRQVRVGVDYKGNVVR